MLKIVFSALMVAVFAASPALAEAQRGKVTNLPIPRYVSMKASEANVRRGPGRSHRIDWVLHHRHTPLVVTAEHGHWRRVEDVEGVGGWIHYSLLSGVRHVLIMPDEVPLLRKPEEVSEVVARAKAGVIAKLGNCEPEWCRVTVQRHSGWVPKSEIWGVGKGELRD